MGSRSGLPMRCGCMLLSWGHEWKIWVLWSLFGRLCVWRQNFCGRDLSIIVSSIFQAKQEGQLEVNIQILDDQEGVDQLLHELKPMFSVVCLNRRTFPSPSFVTLFTRTSFVRKHRHGTFFGPKLWKKRWKRFCILLLPRKSTKNFWQKQKDLLKRVSDERFITGWMWHRITITANLWDQVILAMELGTYRMVFG